MVTHLFAIRAFLPDAIGNANCGSLLAVRDALGEELDRLFIKLRLPNYAVSERDIETPSLRGGIKRLAYDAAIAVAERPSTPPHDALILRGSYDPAEIEDAAERLEDAPLASAAPWALLARLLPDRNESFARYRTLLVRRLGRCCIARTRSNFWNRCKTAADAALDAALEGLRTIPATA